MKKLYFLDDEEKNRILNLHESVTKRNYLNEQPIVPGVPQSVIDPYGINPLGKEKAQQEKVQQEKVQQEKAKQEKAKQQKAQQQKVQQYKQQVVTKTSDITKQIQTLLGLEGTGIMDTSLLQTINTKLNGTQPDTSTTTTTTTLPKSSQFSPDKPENQIPDLKLKNFNTNTSSQINMTDDQINKTMNKIINKPQ